MSSSRPTQVLICVTIGMLAILAVGHCWKGPILYSAAPIEGRIVDASTGRPVAKAVVVATWLLYGGLVEPSRAVDRIAETTTDETGHFSFDGWGWRVRRPFWAVEAQPHLFVFLGGFQPTTTGGSRSIEGFRMFSVIRASPSKGQLEIMPMESAEEQAKLLHYILPIGASVLGPEPDLILYRRAWIAAWEELPPELRSRTWPGSEPKQLMSDWIQRTNEQN